VLRALAGASRDGMASCLLYEFGGASLEEMGPYWRCEMDAGGQRRAMALTEIRMATHQVLCGVQLMHDEVRRC
jgi:hypothetical protein